MADGRSSGLEELGLESARTECATAERSGEGGGSAGSGSSTQSDMGMYPHGLPFNVAGHPWPAGRGEVQHAWEPPRALAKSVKCDDRRAKLHALGNAVVPRCALVVGRILLANWPGGFEERQAESAKSEESAESDLR